MDKSRPTTITVASEFLAASTAPAHQLEISFGMALLQHKTELEKNRGITQIEKMGVLGKNLTCIVAKHDRGGIGMGSNNSQGFDNSRIKRQSVIIVLEKNNSLSGSFSGQFNVFIIANIFASKRLELRASIEESKSH